MLDAIGCARGAAIETFTGRLVDITCITPDVISISDIAHSLSLQCRYNGHSERFYSVAEHSVHVRDYLRNKFPNDRMLQLAGLLHDGSEYAICDIPRPLKPLLTEYASLERMVQDAINAKYGVEVDEVAHDLIKEADNAVLKSEAMQLMATGGKLWGMDAVTSAGMLVKCLSPTKAKKLFLKAFVELM